jgi:LAO/AO transport system kinase
MPIALAQDLIKGERLAISRALSQIENNSTQGRSILEEIFPQTGKAHLIGITGAPGTGKSTLVNQLALQLRDPADGSKPPTVAIIAVDPTSPFSGGALLGDRVRMQDLAGDPGIFVRSMASRGSLGGLAATTAGLVQVFDAAGFDLILIETVGAGQSEVEIASLAHTTIVIEAPGLGDEIQTIKAGILEIADILVVNKADKPGAENSVRALKSMLAFSFPEAELQQHHGDLVEVDLIPGQQPPSGWIPPVLPTVSTTGKGIVELIEALSAHREYLQSSGEWQIREGARLKNDLENLLGSALRSRWEKSISTDQYQTVLMEVIRREKSPAKAVEELIEGAGI